MKLITNKEVADFIVVNGSKVYENPYHIFYRLNNKCYAISK